MIALLVSVGIVGGPAALLAALSMAGEGGRSRMVRPVPPRPARPTELTRAVAWVDPETDDVDASWTDPEAVAA